MNTRLPDLLHDLASEMPTETRTPVHRTLRRARTRRAAVAALGSVVVVAVVLGSISGLRSLSPSEDDRRPVVPATDAPPVFPTPDPSDFQGLWPEMGIEALAITQAAVDDGHHPLRADPEGTATLLTTDLLGWEPGAAETTILDQDAAVTIVELRNSSFGEDAPPITVVLAQLGRTGPNGVWSVVRVETPLVGLVDLSGGPNLFTLQVTGRVTFLDGDGTSIEFALVDGATLDSALGSGVAEVGDQRFEFEVVPTETAEGRATLLVSIPDETGASLGAVLVPVDAPVGEPEPVGPDFTDLPPDVAATAQRIYDAILAGDVDALAPLLDPNTFAYNFDDGSNPIPGWREDPSDLDLAAAILQLPAAEPREIEGYGTFYLWPYLIDSDFANLSDQERADLHFLGYSDEEIQLMIDGGYGYQGPRLGIDADGLWRNFTTVGE